MTKWIDFVKKITKLPQNKGKGLRHSLKQASKLWKKMKGKFGKSSSNGRKKGGYSPEEPEQVPEQVPEQDPEQDSEQEPAQEHQGGRSRKRKGSKKSKTRRR